MADRRMFSKQVVESAKFMKMPTTSRELYFHLGLNADDDGIVEAYNVLKFANASEDDLKVLLTKGFVRVLNEDLVTFITDWRENNILRADRKKNSRYQELLLQVCPDVELLAAKTRSDIGKKSGRSMDRPWTAQCSVGECSVDKYSIGECSTADTHTHQIRYQLDDEILTESEYQNLIMQYQPRMVDSVIERILSKRYHGCLNTAKISEWCEEHTGNTSLKAEGVSEHSGILLELARERGDRSEI